MTGDHVEDYPWFFADVESETWLVVLPPEPTSLGSWKAREHATGSLGPRLNRASFPPTGAVIKRSL